MNQGQKVSTKTSVKVLTVTLIAVSIMALSAAAGIALKKTKTPASVVTFTKNNSVPGIGQTIPPASVDQLLFNFDINATDKAVIVSSIKFNSSNSVKKLTLLRRDGDPDYSTNKATFTNLGEVTPGKASTAIFNNLNLSIPAQGKINLWLKGDFNDVDKTDSIKFSVKDATLKGASSSDKFTFKNLSATGDQITVMGRSKLPTITMTLPEDGSFVSPGMIMWQTKNYPSSAKVDLYLLEIVEGGGIKFSQVIMPITIDKITKSKTTGTSGTFYGSWSRPNDLEAGNYQIFAGCDSGSGFEYGCNPGYSGVFSIN
jgi:hypothetical protein